MGWHRGCQVARFTSLEQRIDDFAGRLLESAPSLGFRAALVEFLVFGLKQAWACIFGALMLVLILAARLWYPDDALLARNDALVIGAVAIQVFMIAARLETGRELLVILAFHIVGTGMELFKTSVGSWSYASGGALHIGPVPLYTGFMYAAVGSYMCRVYRLFDLRFSRYPRIWVTVVAAALIYVNFFTHHYAYDFRYVLLLFVAVLWGRTWMHFRVFRTTMRMPLLLAYLLVALFIWFAENIGTLAGAWVYPNQEHGWELVSITKLLSWFLLMIISVVMVTLAYPPKPPVQGASVETGELKSAS